MHAAEDDVPGLGPGRLSGELQAVAGEVGELDDVVLLVVMAEDDETVAELAFASFDALDEFLIGECGVRRGKRRLKELW